MGRPHDTQRPIASLPVAQKRTFGNKTPLRSQAVKNHIEGILPLNSWLIAQLNARKEGATRSYVFSDRADDERPIRNLKQPISQVSKISGVSFTLLSLKVCRHRTIYPDAQY